MYDLYIGNRLFSSWSLRGWLMLEQFGLPYRAHMVGLYSGTMAKDLKALAPARLVPTLSTPEGLVVGESLAMAETLAERHPSAKLWPDDPAARATARWLCAEMVGGFSNLRADCPMQLRHIWQGFTPSDAVKSDLHRIETLWSHAKSVNTANGPWLFGTYSLADVFYTPVAARIVGYDLPVSQQALSYCKALLSEPAMKAWRAEALLETYKPMPYDLSLSHRTWDVS